MMVMAGEQQRPPWTDGEPTGSGWAASKLSVNVIFPPQISTNTNRTQKRNSRRKSFSSDDNEGAASLSNIDD